MEKIRVNMTPCEEVKTIHASQNDNATRKWAFDLYDENGKIDSSSIKEQMIFDSRVGGTEQILPENTSVPTTSPIIADIQYPDSLRSEQTFLYRESPTQEDGQAKITHIKGNTVVFNQLVENGNFADTSDWSFINGTGSVSNNILTYTITNQVYSEIGYRLVKDISLISGHTYLFFFDVLSPRTVTSVSNNSIKIYMLNSNLTSVNSSGFSATANIWESKTWRFTASENIVRFWLGTGTTTFNVNDVIKYRNVMCIDLTQLHNSAITDVSSFRSYYNLPYYDYTQGKLLPFLGEELKTTNADETETNVLSLPTLTYFPSGMKSAGSVYDEITESKAITRVGSVDLGTLNWTYDSTNTRFRSVDIKTIISTPLDSEKANIIVPNYTVYSNNDGWNGRYDMSCFVPSSGNLFLVNKSYTDATTFKQMLTDQNVKLYYELATPTEESITTASLVTEKGETPLYYDDELIADCNETISSESGIFDAKIKLMDDETVYSQKIQLHVERKPQ